MENTDSTPEAQQEPTQPATDSKKEESIRLTATSTTPTKLLQKPLKPCKLTSRPITQPESGKGSQLPEETYRGIVESLISGGTNIGVSQKYNVATATVSYIRARPEVKEQVPSRQQVLLDKTRHINALAAQRLTEALENGDISPDKLPVAWGIGLTKEIELSGNAPTPNHVHQHLHISHESVSQILDALPTGPADIKCTDSVKDSSA